MTGLVAGLFVMFIFILIGRFLFAVVSASVFTDPAVIPTAPLRDVTCVRVIATFQVFSAAAFVILVVGFHSLSEKCPHAWQKGAQCPGR